MLIDNLEWYDKGFKHGFQQGLNWAAQEKNIEASNSAEPKPVAGAQPPEAGIQHSKDKICADIIENKSPCAYCTESGKGNCHKCAIQTHGYFFKGRKLRPC